ncbi:serine proteinase [Coprinopsis cinerea okayama7|uniref:Serine proteinase n=1 Tax=Coprinopsis cinerea (strain Okayama-7 / 130 / ATCC MYA-4618 / FGSC 9003) TaxID=240176 RepID=A8NP24_COPC7|nr:serine proteinase [Coprinopsis cinerea okayama7\|eukprot:XP_001835249.2 serine proteinase [Coprinopsis cinerea okayama7\
MRLSTIFTTFAVLLATPVLSAPGASLKSVERYAGPTSGKHIVKLKDGVSRNQWMRKLKLPSDTVELNLINGFSGTLNDETLAALQASEDVEFISEDGIVQMHSPVTHKLDFKYTYESSAAGSGVDIYLTDTGILTTHTDFGGRARWGGSFGVGGGIAAGARWGVAKNASLIAVRVLSNSGQGPVSGIVAGLDWIRSQAAASGRPSVVSMSLGGSVSQALDDAVTRVSAGNDNKDAFNVSPARVPSAITVGAANIFDAKAAFSNFGPVVTVYAPGQNVTSAWIGADNASSNRVSGTSMAAPHIAGLVAYLISKDGNISPAQMQAKIQNLAVKGAISGLPSGTANNLAQIGPL